MSAHPLSWILDVKRVCLLFVVECCYYSYGGINDSHIHFYSLVLLMQNQWCFQFPVICRLCVDYCNTLLAGAPKVTTDKLQRVFNAAARVLTGTHKFDRACRGCCTPSCTGSTYLSESHTSSESSCSAAAWSSSTVFNRLLSTGLRCGLTAAPPFSQSTSSGRTASPCQHVRPPGVCCGWPDGLQLFPG